MTTATPIPTTHENKLAEALKGKDIIFEQQYWDGYKHIDIYIPSAKLNIEVDGTQHLTRAKQILSDFNREYWADKKGYYTLHIPNSAIDGEYFDRIVDAIVEVVNQVVEKLK